MSHEPQATAAALWLRAWLAGDASADATVAALARALPDCATVQVLAELRDVGVDRAWLLLPRPGATVGWPKSAEGAPSPSVLLLRVGAARGLLSAEPGRQRLVVIEPEPTTALAGQAMPARSVQRAMSEVVLAAARELESLDLARPARGAATSAWAATLNPLPPGLSPEAVGALERAAAVLDAVELALTEEGVASTAAESAARSERLRVLRNSVLDLVVALVAGLSVEARVADRPAAASLR